MSTDRELLFLVNRHWEHPFLDWSMAVASSLPAWIPLFAVALAVIYRRRGPFRTLSLVTVLALTVAVADGLVARTLKHSVGRPRPHQVVEGLTVRDLQDVKPRIRAVFLPPTTKPSKPAKSPVDGRSFPSAHVVNTTAVATAFVFLFGWRWAWLYAVAAVVAYSRVYNASHWPSDIPASVLLGIACGWAVPAVCEFTWRRAAASVAPVLAEAHPTLRSRGRRNPPGRTAADATGKDRDGGGETPS